MKLKKIFLLLGITIGGFLSCTSESVIDEPLIGSQELSILLTSGNVTTKAEEVPSDWERKINDCHVAIFNAEGTRIYSKNFTSLGDPDTNADGHPAYTLSLGDVRTFGKGVKKISVYILANAGDYSAFDAYDSYSDYREKGRIETYPFVADKLVKAGLKADETLEYDTKTPSNNTKEIIVPLTQLTARVDFKGIEVTGQSGEDQADGGWQTGVPSHVKSKSDWPNKFKDIAEKKEDCDDWIGDGYYDEDEMEDAKKRVILFRQARSRSSSSGYECLPSSQVIGVNKESSVTIYNNMEVENRVQALTTIHDAETLVSSFYTYENCEISLSLDVRFSKSGTETQERYGHLVQRRRKKGYWPSVDTSNVTWDGWSTISSPSGPDETKTYELTLPALVKGNIYQVKGKVDREFLSEFKWEVTPVPLQDTPVDIPVFN